MSELFDTHCHVHELSRVDMPLYSKWMADHSTTRTIATVLTAARQAGVSRLLCIGTSLADSQLAADFAVKHDGVWAAIAIHPHDAKITSHEVKNQSYGRMWPQPFMPWRLNQR